MDNWKYKVMLSSRIHDHFQMWSKRDSIMEKEMYAFLHMLKGTSGTLGLTELGKIAAEKLEQLHEEGNQLWKKEQWIELLNPIIETQLFYEKNMLTATMEEQLVREFILVINDEMETITFFKQALEKEGYSVVIAHNGRRGVELFHSIQPAIVFIDSNLPDVDGYSLLKYIKNMKKSITILAFMSNEMTKENHLKAYKLGAMDFIPKPIDEFVLQSYVKNRLAHYKELEYAIVIDELTQVYNRKFFENQLQLLIKQYEKTGNNFSLAIMDLDYFKQINDRNGHLAGDRVLKEFAATVMEMKRAEDIFCRYGGEEFMLLMLNTVEEEAYNRIEEIRQVVENTVFNRLYKPLNVTFSSGVITVSGQHDTGQKMVEAADRALYSAKLNGRNQVVLFNDSHILNNKKTNLKVIVIDDVFIIREMIIEYFKEQDEQIEVLSYEDGESFLRGDWYDPTYKYIILLDWMLPGVGGIEVLKEIRKLYDSDEVIISMLTGKVGEKYVVEAFEYGVDDYISKPFQMADVYSRILHLADRTFSS